MIAGMILAAALAVLGPRLSIVALAGLILHLIRPRWISVAAGAAIGVLRARTTAGAAVVGFATQPPPVVEPQPRGPSQDLTLLGA
ncbi:MAG TPA: hypothetical protein PKA64_13655 [Myxococcota bacterium]|nr:hypothetical protein [Myxococcota bacterium]